MIFDLYDEFDNPSDFLTEYVKENISDFEEGSPIPNEHEFKDEEDNVDTRKSLSELSHDKNDFIELENKYDKQIQNIKSSHKQEFASYQCSKRVKPLTKAKNVRKCQIIKKEM